MQNESLRLPLSTGKPLVYGSVCSGIEAATVAWHPLGWTPAFFSEIDSFPRAVLQHHYPSTPLHGDFTTIQEHDYAAIDLLVGGTPCQSFSVAGLRKGFADERGNLTLEFIRLAQRLKSRWLVWENVPGVLSIDGGRAFGSFLGGLAECGYGFAYRILDAQHFGVPQRRRRVFVVGYLGDWRPPAAVLFERQSLCRDIAPRRETRTSVAALTANGVGTCGADDNQGQAGHLIAHALRGEGFDASEDGTGRGIPLIADTLTSNGDSHSGYRDEKGLVPMTLAIRGRENESRLEIRQDGLANALLTPNGGRSGMGVGAVAIPINTQLGLRGSETSNSTREGVGIGQIGDPAFTLQREHHHAVQHGMAVRRLTPRECERLQGFPDDYTLIPNRGKPAADGPRYKALGNSMAVPCMRWIGERIQMVETVALQMRRAA